MSDVDVAEFEDAEVREFLSELNEKTAKIKGAKKEYAGLLSIIVFQDVNQHFEQERGSGGPWVKWSESYRESMQKRGRAGNKILQDSGRLKNSFLPKNYRQTSNGILWFNPAKTKTGFPYAAAHEEGGSTLPQRDFMWLSDQAMDKIEIQTLQFLLEKGL